MTNKKKITEATVTAYNETELLTGVVLTGNPSDV